MGFLLLADLLIRSSDLRAMYTDDGMFSRAEICHRVTSLWNWSFHFASGAWEYQAMLFGLAAVLAVALIVGFETRLATIGSWLMLLSLQHRVPPVLSGADILFRMLLFWGMFLPLERAWSVDNWLRSRRLGEASGGTRAAIVSVASAAILLQMAQMYFFSAIFKSTPEWYRGEVIAGALTHGFYVKPAGTYFLKFPIILALLTWGTFVLEWVGPILLFSPKYTAWFRMVCASSLALMHLGIALCLRVDFFSPVSLAGLVLFVPPEVWDLRWLTRRAPESVANAPKSTVRVESAGAPWSYLREGLCLFFLLYVIMTNLNTLPSHPFTRDDSVTKTFLRTACGLAQKWNMFDEIPSKNGWYVAQARLNDGSEVDLLRKGAAVDWDRPPYPAALYPNHRWRKCFREMAYEDEIGFQVFRKPVADYLCRDWNSRHGEDKRVTEFNLIFCMINPAEAQQNLQVTVQERLVHLDAASVD